MSHRFPIALAVLGILGLAGPLQAGEYPFTHEMKLRMGFSPQHKDNLGSYNTGFGFNLGWGAPAGGKFTVELGYQYQTGNDYLEGYQPPAPGMAPVDIGRSWDHRKHVLDGMALRFAYERNFSDSEWGWQAGLMYGGTEFKEEVQADLRSVGWKYVTVQPSPALWRDQYWRNETDKYRGISPFAGFKYNATPRSHIEINLLILNYRASSLVHIPGGSPNYPLTTMGNSTATNLYGPTAAFNDFPLDRVETSTRFVPHLEFGYSFHF